MEAVYAHYCLHKLHMRPKKFLKLDRRERAFIIASIDEKIESDKEEAEKIKNKR